MAEFDPKYFDKLAKDLSLNEIKASVNFVFNVDADSFRVDVTWVYESSQVGNAQAIIDLNKKEAYFTRFYLDSKYQQKGIYTRFVEHALKEWPKRGVEIVSAAYQDIVSKTVLETNGFIDPDTLDPFSLDLKGKRAKELRAYFRGGEEPDWRIDRKQEIAARSRR